MFPVNPQQETNTKNMSNTTLKLVTVAGSTGNQGGAVIDYLLKYPDQFQIRALTRNTGSQKAQELSIRGIQVVQCDLNNYEQVRQAVADSYAVFAMTNYWEAKDEEIVQGINLAKASVEANVQHLVWAGLPDADTITNKTLVMPHYQNKYVVEKYIRDHCQSIHYVTFLYVGFYFSNFSTWFRPELTEQGEYVYHQPLDTTATLPLYDVHDTGSVTVACLLNPEQHGQRSLVPLVSENLTIKQVCDILTEVTGKTVRHDPVSFEEYSKDKTQESVDNIRWYNDYENVGGREAEVCRQVYPDMKTFKAWLIETKYMQ